MRLGDDPIQHVAHPGERAGRTRAAPARRDGPAARHEAPATRERVARLAGRENDRDPLGQQAAGDERERARRRAVEPLRVVDDAQERLLLDSLRQQAEDGQPDQERVRSRSGAEPEGYVERIALGIRQTLRWSRIGEHSCWSAANGSSISPSTPTVRSDPKSAPPRPSIEQRGLADAGLAVHRQHPAWPSRAPPAGGRAPRARAAGRAVGLPGAACASECVTANPSTATGVTLDD